MAAFKYKAFISYSHHDTSWADWLHGQLEGYQPPADLHISTALAPIFQDKEELAASPGLSETIEAALLASEYLIVVCSPAAVASTWVQTEIERFISLGRDNNIFCLIVDGVPNSVDEECLPGPLQHREPLAADVRAGGHTRSNAMLRLIAGLLGVEFNDLRRREASIAVLPFRDLSPETDQQYLSDGLAEELSSQLTQLRDLRVISRSSAFQFRDSAMAVAAIGEQLDATYVVEGSIQTMGNALRVSVALIDVRTDSTKWSSTYNRDLNDIFALQDEIASAVASELHRTVRNQGHVQTTVDGKAYELVLRAKHLAQQFTQEALQKSNELLLQAVALEPDYLEAWNGLVSNYTTQAGEGFASEDVVVEAKDVIAKVLAIDPHNTDALSGLGWLALRFDNDLPAAARYLQRALTSGSNTAHVLNSVGGLLIRLRRFDDAILVSRYVTKLDPLNSYAHANLGVYSLFAGRHDQAIAAYRTALDISPGFVGAHFAIGLALLEKDELPAALISMDREADDEFRCKGRALVFWRQGQATAFQAELELLIATWGEDWPSEVAEVYAYAAMADQAFAWIYRDIDLSQGAGWAESVVNPVFDKIAKDVRWQTLLQKLALAPAQLAEIDLVLPEALQASLRSVY